MRRISLLALTTLICTAGGCLSTREHRHIYSLEGAVDASGVDEGMTGRPVMELQRVLVPDYLDTTDILLRVGAHEIRESATGRFGERLSLEITHALRADLALQMPRKTIELTQSAGAPTRQILITVEAFDVSLSGHCVLVADWSILDASRRSLLASDRGTFSATAAGPNAVDGTIITAMADAVRQLAGRITLTAEALPPNIPDR